MKVYKKLHLHNRSWLAKYILYFIFIA